MYCQNGFKCTELYLKNNVTLVVEKKNVVVIWHQAMVRNIIHKKIYRNRDLIYTILLRSLFSIWLLVNNVKNLNLWTMVNSYFQQLKYKQINNAKKKIFFLCYNSIKHKHCYWVKDNKQNNSTTYNNEQFLKLFLPF